MISLQKTSKKFQIETFKFSNLENLNEFSPFNELHPLNDTQQSNLKFFVERENHKSTCDDRLKGFHLSADLSEKSADSLG